LAKITITFPDKSQQEFDAGITPLEIARGISNRLAKRAVAAKFNGQIVSLLEPLNESGELQILTFDDKEGREVFWHSSAHLMAQAIKRLFPEAKLGIGPAIEDGFYYDIDLERAITPEDFPKIEAEMARIVDENLPIVRKELDAQEAIEFFKKINETLKVELIEEFAAQGEKITAYSQGEFTDLCRGPHVPSTGYLGKHFKLLSVAGAYWRGDEKNKMLQRVYATNYPDKKQLKAHLHRLEEAKKRDHRKLGRELDLFSIQDEIGSGLILWHPKGALVRYIIEKYIQDELLKNGYQLVTTPHIAKFKLWEISGHANFYRENMFGTMVVDDVEYQLKPMNCPFHMMIYKSKIRSYRELPIRFAELGTVYRYERSGVLHGLMRVRGFTQDDAHIFCTPDQIKSEFNGVIDIIMRIFKALSFDNFITQISLRDPNTPEKYIGSDENWEKAERAIMEVADERGLDAKVEYGEAAFYGPKMDFMVRDAIGRKWQLGTIQVDYNLPERFDLTYIGADNEKHRPVMIHRAPFGSMERFVAVLIEHCAGNFPLWLTPDQAIILPISEKYQDYAEKVLTLLKNSEIRALIDGRSEKTGRKIRDAEMKKIPYMLIVGEKEESEGTVSVRKHGGEDLGTYSIEDFANMVNNECEQLMNIQ